MQFLQAAGEVIPEGHGYKTWHWGGDNPSGYINQNAFAQVNLPGQSNLQGAGQVIAVLDTGVDLNHPALQGHLLPGRDMVDDLQRQGRTAVKDAKSALEERLARHREAADDEDDGV